MLDAVTCPECVTRVFPMANGECPRCRAQIAEPSAPAEAPQRTPPLPDAEEQEEQAEMDGGVRVAVIDGKDAVRIALMRTTESGVELVFLKTVDSGGEIDRWSTVVLVVALPGTLLVLLALGRLAGWPFFFVVAILAQLPVRLLRPRLRREKARVARRRLTHLGPLPMPQDAKSLAFSRQDLSKATVARERDQLKVKGAIIVSLKPLDRRFLSFLPGAEGGPDASPNGLR